MSGIPRNHRLSFADRPAVAGQPGALEPGAAARVLLLVHDMQRYFLRPLPESLRAGLVANAARLRRWCVEQGVQIAYTAQPGSMTEEQRGLLKRLLGPGMRASPADREVVEELAPGPDDWLLTKRRYSASSTPTCSSGCAPPAATSWCCAAYTPTSGADLHGRRLPNDIQPFLVADAIADFSEAHHRMALEYAASRCAMVVTTDEVLE